MSGLLKLHSMLTVRFLSGHINLISEGVFSLLFCFQLLVTLYTRKVTVR